MRKLLKLIILLIGKRGFVFYIFLGIFSGLCNFLFITSLTKVISLLISKKYVSISIDYIIVFISIILLFMWIRRSLSIAIVNLSQNLLWKIRKQVISLVLKANFHQLSNRRARIYSAIVNDINTLTQASLNMIGFFTSFVMAIACLIYLGSISIVLLLITLAVAVIGVAIYYINSKRSVKQLETVRVLDSRFLEHLNAILDGFKEIFIEPKKGKEIYNDKISKIAVDSYKSNSAAFTGLINNQITGQVLFYILITAILLVFSVKLKVEVGNIVSFIFTLLYLLSSIEAIMLLLPGLLRARVASKHLMDLKSELENEEFSNNFPEKDITPDEFEKITLNGLKFEHKKTDKSFKIGPIDLNIDKGDIIFIYGSNGSGKTTLIYSILGLHIPDKGSIKLNSKRISEKTYAEYRSIFSVVFSDFYLFEELYGIEDVDMDRLKYLLKLFDIDHLVNLNGRAFSTLSLSTGQRKRLALIAALLEKKPVLVLDEWAADQDPYFRKKFYTEIIPGLKKEGITVIAITHDDNYYHCADKLYKMDYGKLIQVEKNHMVKVNNIVSQHSSS
ncbi:cyclic peptide export ABC transporter [Pedobacter sp. AW31-3R]|uniref:cyclic peptide export ABC transporter n=1 Tax=Pedobacter sp. AW31-3R TaxID=3445781 RepID=UPI003FA0DE6F